jgi:hypothetical protein
MVTKNEERGYQFRETGRLNRRHETDEVGEDGEGEGAEDSCRVSGDRRSTAIQRSLDINEIWTKRRRTKHTVRQVRSTSRFEGKMA